MQHLFKFGRFAFVMLLSVFMLQGCGGDDEKEPVYSISADVNTVEFANEFLQISDDSIAVKVNFSGNGLLVGFAPETQVAPWLRFRTEDVTDTSATVFIDVINAERVNPALYETKIRLSSGDATTLNLAHHDIDISLLVWQLITDKQRIEFMATSGDANVDSQTLSITSEDNRWSASIDVDWITLDKSSGVGTDVITLSPNIEAFTAPGLQDAILTLTETTTGDSKQIPIELGLDNVYLFANQSHVHFVSTPNLRVLEKNLTIATNFHQSLNWQASTEATWLTLEPNQDSNQLKVAVDTNALADEETLSTAITFTVTDTDHVITQSVPVSFYRSDETTSRQVIEEVTVNSGALASAPNQVSLYVGVDNSLNVYHQYTGELLSSHIISPEGTLLSQFIIHPSGEFLLARAIETITNDDETTETIVHRYKVNLIDYNVTKLEESNLTFEPSQFVRIAGRSFVISQALEIADENLQLIYWDQSEAFFSNAIDSALNTNSIYAYDGTEGSIKRLIAQANDFTTGKAVISVSHEYRPESLEEGQGITDFVVDNNEENIYLISETSQHISFDGESFTDNGLLDSSENVVHVAVNKNTDGLAHFTRIDTSVTRGFYVDIYNKQQKVTASISTLGGQPRSVNISQDDSRLILDTASNSSIELLTLHLFETSLNALSFSSTFGDSETNEQTIELTGVGENWQATADVPWLLLTPNTTEDQHSLTVAINHEELSQWGLLSAEIVIYDPQSTSYQVVTVEFAVDEPRLYSDSPAIAFNSQVDRSALSQTVNIYTNKATQFAWQASSDANWLTLSVDSALNTLTLTVDPSAISENGTFYSQVQLSPVDASEGIGGVIEVSFTKGTFDTSTLDEIRIESVVPNSEAVVLDPLRPHLYIAQQDGIDIYHVITGEKITRINSPLADVALTNLVIHPNGSILLASNSETYTDDNNEEQQRVNHYQVNLESRQIEQLDSDLVTIEYRPIDIIMVSGKAIVVTQTQEFANLTLERQFWDSENVFFADTASHNVATNTLSLFNAAQSSVIEHTLSYNAFAENTVEVENTQEYENDAFSDGVAALATNADGSILYTANTTSEWAQRIESVLTDQGMLDDRTTIASINVTTDASDNVYVYRFDVSVLVTGSFTLSKYDTNQALIWNAGYTAGSRESYILPAFHRVAHYNETEQTMVMDFTPQ